MNKIDRVPVPHRAGLAVGRRRQRDSVRDEFTLADVGRSSEEDDAL